MKHYFPRKIKTLVAIDGSTNCWAWLKKIKHHINIDNCRITLIIVPKSFEEVDKAKKILELTLEFMDDENFLFMHEDSVIKVGEAAKIIIDYANEHNFDLIVLGSHNKTKVERFFMGSVSSMVVLESHVPVLVMKI
ncbi:MAG: universal stress protein [Cyanobacteriota bacterium]